MRRAAFLLPPLLLAGCGGPKLTPEQQEAADRRAIAAVEAAQDIPAQPVSPEPILTEDIERYDLLGGACRFMPEHGPAATPQGKGALAFVNEGGAYLKVDGEMLRLAPDAGSPELPLGARGRYDGKAYSIILDIARAEGEPSGMETIDFPARLVLRNARDQTVYAASGIAECGS